ncbi:hypothetical protein GCM10011369_08100 [Neiella marina]|uniref:2'-5' RNA ligase superfamily protein n=1 Tax=Neiella marina TaxID=508461 RepID=A0A8J2U349_9GAMM|nr:hypothetical protein [Neiella marina]GGA68865.1 hypothetical protein GCM10011369_08100 [Neiella marina]
MIQRIYDDMWREFCFALQQRQYQIDRNIHNPADTRRGLTALAYISANSRSVSDEIANFIAQLKGVEPAQYYYPVDEVHLTLLSIISCIEGFQLCAIAPGDYVEVFTHALLQSGPIDIEFRGITASPACIVIQGFPVGDGLATLRDTLRRNFNATALKTSFDSRYKLVTAHCSAIRFCSPIDNPERLLDCCQQYRDHHFGTARLSDFELVFNDWYQRRTTTQSLAKYAMT